MIRVGFGIDVHKFVENRDLWIGGVKIPYEFGLAGHSDADVLLHAVMDALLGASAKGDIGKHFPDTDEKYRDADSLELLAHVMELIKNDGYSVSNIDVTIIAQAPKLAPHIEQMVNNLSRTMNLDTSRINVKATTTEKLGFTGRKEGIAAEAVCILTKGL